MIRKIKHVLIFLAYVCAWWIYVGAWCLVYYVIVPNLTIYLASPNPEFIWPAETIVLTGSMFVLFAAIVAALED